MVKTIAQAAPVADRYPRLLVIDATRIGSLSATGQIKQQLLAGWPAGQFMQIHDAGGGQIGIYDGHGESQDTAPREVVDHAHQFDPEVVYVRPLPEPPAFASLTWDLLAAFEELPTATHIMDDWMERLRVEDRSHYADTDSRLRSLLERSTHRFVVSDEMAAELWRRYGLRFEPFANCVDPVDWIRIGVGGPPQSDGPVRFRYSGALADDMTRSAVREVAAAIDAVAVKNPAVFEISVFGPWWRQANKELGGYETTRIERAERDVAAYRRWLGNADVCVLAYNFDPRTARYVQLSMANKLPQYLAAGRPVLAYGPPAFATVQRCFESGGAVVVDRPDPDALRDAVQSLVADPQKRGRLGERGRRYAFTSLNVLSVRRSFQERLIAASKRQSSRPGIEIGEHPRSHHSTLDETAIIARLQVRAGHTGTMVDVGAHRGSSLAGFARASWRVVAFEPDPDNRQSLLRTYGSNELVTVDGRAVSDTTRDQLPFYTSTVSSGISGLSAFHASHEQTSTVDAVSLADACTEHGIEKIDVLKIDTEGYELAVLKGHDWEVPPGVVCCEFEDRKTRPLGYDTHDLARFLCQRGYDVWVSEWHPVIEYGQQHDWRRLVKYPCEFDVDTCWGNLIAFQDAPPDHIVREAVEAELESWTKHTEPERPTVPRPDIAHRPDRRWRTERVRTSGLGVYGRPSRRHEGLVDGLAELRGAFQGRLALPAASAAAAFASALVISFFVETAWPIVALLAAGGIGLLLSVGIAVVRTRRERDRAGAKLQGEVGILAEQLRDSMMADLRTLAGSVTDLTAGLEATDERQRHRSSQDDARYQRLEASADELSKRIGELQERFEAPVTELESVPDRLDEADQARHHLKTEVSELSTAVDAVQRKMHDAASQRTEVRQRVDDVAEGVETVKALAKPLRDRIGQEQPTRIEDSKTVAANARRYQPFTRSLSDSDVATLTDDWARRLGCRVTPSELGYLAHHLGTMEERCSGRLATSVQSLLLRVMVARSALSFAAENKQPLQILEIGTMFGLGLGLLYEACRDRSTPLHLTAVDPLDGYYRDQAADPVTGVPVTRDVLEENLRRMSVPSEACTILQDRSPEALTTLLDATERFQLIIIDGDHSLEGVRADLEGAIGHLARGGFVLLDDYGSQYWPDVTTFVDEEAIFRPDLQFVGAVFNTAVFRGV